MADTGDSREKRASSDPKEIPQQTSVKFDFNSSQCASFISQRSSSLETFGSVTSLSPSSDGNTAEPQSDKNLDKNASSAGDSTLESVNVSASRDSGNESTAGNGEDPSSDSQAWMYSNESLPSSMLHPAHRSTPVKDCEYLSTVSEEGGTDNTRDEDATGEDEEEDGKEKAIYFPGDLTTPILGYETMEARSRFTVYKIHVQKAATESTGWFVFRRYSDFLHLNERLKYQFPGFRLSLPPKRWFRDNFDPNFLEDRVLGLQAFLDNITGHKDILNSAAVRAFLCIDDPPGPHDSLEESRALCETLEESVYGLKQELQERESEVALLREELELYKSQVELLSNQLRVVTGSAPNKGEEAMTPSSTRHSLAECDRDTPPSTPTAHNKSGDEAQAQDSQQSEEASSSTE